MVFIIIRALNSRAPCLLIHFVRTTTCVRVAPCEGYARSGYGWGGKGLEAENRRSSEPCPQNAASPSPCPEPVERRCRLCWVPHQPETRSLFKRIYTGHTS